MRSIHSRKFHCQNSLFIRHVWLRVTHIFVLISFSLFVYWSHLMALCNFITMTKKEVSDSRLWNVSWALSLPSSLWFEWSQQNNKNQFRIWFHSHISHTKISWAFSESLSFHCLFVDPSSMRMETLFRRVQLQHLHTNQLEWWTWLINSTVIESI